VTWQQGRPRVCAHRGGAGLAPENTLAACRQALALGVRWLEVDVRCTADGVPVLLHDETVDRTTDGHGPVRQLRFAQVRRLDAGSWFGPAFRGERVPSLEEFFGLLADTPEAGAYVEVKEGGEEGSRLAHEALELAGRGGLEPRIRLASFSPEPLQRARELHPRVVRVALQEPFDFTDPVRFVQDRTAQVWGPYHRSVTEERVQALHRRGVGVYAWTVNDPAEALRLLRLGLGGHPEDAVVTDFPDRFLVAERRG
jgi:glycerophosphoryl diester phosphodiesterase